MTKKYWTISYEDDFVKQVSKFNINIQANIQKAVSNVATFEDPREAGAYSDCGTDDEDCPYITQIYPGLAFEFTYEMDPHNNELTYIDCYELDFLSYGQESNI